MNDQANTKKRVQVDISEAVVTEAKVYAIRTGTTLAEVVEAALSEYLERQKTPTA